eukprot:CAMPEP_0185770642 /NCGR_PEP_ID=MMETSP1174-20130828/60301_1 /TAXON_ID=35687 /ORGANISM="Dictyocha speculum, Strain CCMP1381" /LENGTH=314 /DNA_ID=CAMNT_0028456169 /DNA_START=1 /DNA_END=945 /DNA_ORIENTATION=-
MMDGAYFVGRKDILDWINELLDLNICKIEETCSGAVACQLIDAHFPGKIPMSKVNWEAKNDYEYISNYKVLQTAFGKLKIDRAIDVEKLVRGKYQDNLEFMQWFKGFCDRHQNSADYNPAERRSKGKGARKLAGRSAGGSSSDKTRSSASSSTGTGSSTRSSATQQRRPPRTQATARSDASASNTASMEKDKENWAQSQTRPRRDNAKSSSGRANDEAAAALQAKLEDVEEKNRDLQLTVDAVEKERDFYYDKLRDIEILLQNKQEAQPEEETESAVMNDIFKILYATTEEFVAVGDDGNPVVSNDEAKDEAAS